MGKMFLKYVIIPLGTYIIGIVILLFLFSAGNESFAGLISGYLIGFPPLIVVWWFIVLSRWLYSFRRLETLSFLIANLSVGFGIIILGFTLAMGFINYNEDYMALTFLAGVLIGFLWFIHSLYFRISQPDWQYLHSIHFLPLEYELMSVLPLNRWKMSKLKTKVRSSYDFKTDLGTPSISSLLDHNLQANTNREPLETKSQQNNNFRYSQKPEEMVVKYVLAILEKVYGFDKRDIAVEFPIQMGSSSKRADIVVFNHQMVHRQENIYIIIECKRADRALKQVHISQLKSYMSACVNVRFGILASSVWLAWEKVQTHSGLQFEKTENIPNVSNEKVTISYRPPTPV